MQSNPPLRCLLVEDDDTHARLIQLAMSRVSSEPPTMDRVRDGQEALSYLKRESGFSDRETPDLILLDLKLPKISGHEVLEAVKADEYLRVIPVVVLTTSDSENDRIRAYAAHANSYLVKPMAFEQFMQMLRDLNAYWGQWNRRVQAG
jgi:CheY-like chemotaxis protein